mmetsp:Transcript_11664/g.21809  ORF Transcript_11664/g.21809 Transcript_11664/m.21809 type:complete len:409 (-) Transcript_11664:106-1332(-)
MIGVLDLLTSGLLTHLPQDIGHLTSNLGSTRKDEGAVSTLENSRVFLNNHHGAELLDGQTLSLLLKVDDISRRNNLFLGNTLDGHTNRVSRSSRLQLLLVLLNGKDLLTLEAYRSNSDNISGTKSSLLNGSANNLTNSLNVIHSGDGKAERSVGLTLRRNDQIIQSIKKGESGDLDLGLEVSLPSLVPGSLVGLHDKVISVKSRVRNERNLLGLEANDLKHLGELVLDLIETSLVPVAGVHLVNSDNNLLNSEKVKKTGVLTGLSFLNSELGVSLGDSSLETSLLSGNEKKTYISGSGSGDHVLYVILVSRSIDDGIVVLLGEELLGVTLDGNSTFTLLLTGIKVVSETEGRLSLLFGQSLKLCHFTVGNSSALEDKVTTGGGLSSIYVSADNKRKMFFSSFSHDESM